MLFIYQGTHIGERLGREREHSEEFVELLLCWRNAYISLLSHPRHTVVGDENPRKSLEKE